MSDPGFAGAVVRPYPYAVVVRWGAQVVASSDAAMRIDTPGRVPQLAVPWSDVRQDSIAPASPRPADELADAVVESFDALGPGPTTAEAITWGSPSPGMRDGIGIVRRLVQPPAELSVLVGYALIDHDQARVDVIDTVAGDEARDVTIKRFPTWGDAADLIAILDSRSIVHDTQRPVVEGSQLLAQTIVAAMRRTGGRRVVSAHMVFLRAADTNQPIDIQLEDLSSGRTFSSVDARITQGGRVCAAGTLLLGAPATDVVRHRAPAADLVGPYDAVPHDMGVTGRDLRVVDAAYTDDPAAPVGPPTIDAWVRFRSVPDDPALHAGLLAQFTGHMSIAAALRPHAGVGQREAHRTLSTAINAIAISFHADVRMDAWVVYRHLSTVVADGMAHSECRVHAEDGTHLASFSVDAMIRPLERAAVDDRTAM